MAKLCNTCRWWENIYRHAGKDWGHCGHPVASQKMALENSKQEGDSETFTEECFGCIYWEGKGGKQLLQLPKS